MRYFLFVIGAISGLLSLAAMGAALAKGTDIQMIASGVFGTMFAVCLGLGAVIAKLEALKRSQP